MLVDTKKINTLQKLGRKYHTDKGSHHYKGITYLHIYEIFLRQFRKHHMTMLELGVKSGASVRMWRDFFPRGQIYGLDINPRCKSIEKDRIHITIGKQDDWNALKKIVNKAQRFDVILDDCSHIHKLTIRSFNYLWPYVKPDGYYIIEDLRDSYKINIVRKDINRLFLKLIKSMDCRTGDIGSIHFYPMVCIIGKTK